jgi:uncharacterized protein Yka (UPF0111/DUF47 family)
MDAARALDEELQALAKGDKNSLGAALEKVRKAEDDVTTLRRALIRELAEIGTLMVSREDLLRTAYAIETIVGHVNGTAFKISQVSKGMLKDKKYRQSLQDLVGLLIRAISKLNEGVRALSINPDQAIEMAAEVQRIESEVDMKYREMIAGTIRNAKGYKELITLKDVVEAIENSSDTALLAADATTILALGL